jgi:hypothetical protein
MLPVDVKMKLNNAIQKGAINQGNWCRINNRLYGGVVGAYVWGWGRNSTRDQPPSPIPPFKIVHTLPKEKHIKRAGFNSIHCRVLKCSLFGKTYLIKYEDSLAHVSQKKNISDWPNVCFGRSCHHQKLQ